ncbi:TDP-N-acetylfucosamine:lipid II N-acetylfucosaminyltransferase [Providencia sp. PROV169]|uniref:TDP-N-acetylfucosamine:lipid II N-acetylfucosaminyltransferase n=1 Tax=Providencia sp. PROV169 TaxID=2949875 RepID=UPI00234A1823|nr:TDP-N-acetylfucosamine:lipid II N-acetylfucosaminyltransferase [Providencia sp. PROV169]
MFTLHVASLDKFIPPIINLIRKLDLKNKQFFYTYGDKKKYPYDNQIDSIHKEKNNNLIHSFLSRYIPLLIKMYRAEKIVLHGLFDIYLVIILAFNPWLLKKCYWLIWGGDLYYHNDDIVKPSRKKKIFEFFRRIVIKNIGYLVTYVPGDILLARKWYSAKGEYIECYMYLSNISNSSITVERKDKDYIAIQIGNSADPSNNHMEILDSLKKYKSENIKIYIPLSYGGDENIKTIIDYAKSIFNENVIFLTDFLPFSQYMEFLSEIDIAIFNHDRQQAMGNIITLLSLGKTVYINSSTTQWSTLINYNLKLNDTRYINLNLLSKDESENNIKIINEKFNQKNLISQYKTFL